MSQYLLSERGTLPPKLPLLHQTFQHLYLICPLGLPFSSSSLRQTLLKVCETFYGPSDSQTNGESHLSWGPKEMVSTRFPSSPYSGSNFQHPFLPAKEEKKINIRTTIADCFHYMTYKKAWLLRVKFCCFLLNKFCSNDDKQCSCVTLDSWYILGLLHLFIVSLTLVSNG